MTWVGVVVPTGEKPGALKMFDLKTGAPKGSVALPPAELLGQTSLCNDIAVASDGTAYVTDTFAGRVLRLKPGAKSFEIWATDPRWDVKGPQLDGIAILGDGNVYANIFEGDGLYRIEVKPNGSAGTVTKLQTSVPLHHSDGLRPLGNNTLLMVEGEGVGRLDLITVTGDTAKIDVVKDGFEGPVSVTRAGNIAYVLDVPLKYLFNPDFKGKKPPPFRAYAVPLPTGQ
jgi:hypothetical protein